MVVVVVVVGADLADGRCERWPFHAAASAHCMQCNSGDSMVMERGGQHASENVLSCDNRSTRSQAKNEQEKRREAEGAAGAGATRQGSRASDSNSNSNSNNNSSAPWNQDLLARRPGIVATTNRGSDGAVEAGRAVRGNEPRFSADKCRRSHRTASASTDTTRCTTREQRRGFTDWSWRPVQVSVVESAHTHRRA